MTKKINNSATVAAAVAAAFSELSAKHESKRLELFAVDCSLFGEHEIKQHRAAMLGEANRAKRCADFARCMGNEAFAAAFTRYALTVDSVMRLQIYAQDKLLATVRAIAADRALSSVQAGNHSNMMTQRLIAALDAAKDSELSISDAPRKMHDLFPDKSMGTYSAQASSSRQTLEILGLLSFDSMRKTFKLNENGDALRSVIAN